MSIFVRLNALFKRKNWTKNKKSFCSSVLNFRIKYDIIYLKKLNISIKYPPKQKYFLKINCNNTGKYSRNI